jgi:hypothetical protein
VWRALLADAVLRGDIQQFMNQIRSPQLPTSLIR